MASNKELILSNLTVLSDLIDTITDFKNADSKGLKAMLEAIKGKMDYLDKDSVATLFNSKIQKMIKDFEDKTLKKIVGNNIIYTYMVVI